MNRLLTRIAACPLIVSLLIEPLGALNCQAIIVPPFSSVTNADLFVSEAFNLPATHSTRPSLKRADAVRVSQIESEPHTAEHASDFSRQLFHEGSAAPAEPIDPFAPWPTMVVPMDLSLELEYLITHDLDHATRADLQRTRANRHVEQLQTLPHILTHFVQTLGRQTISFLMVGATAEELTTFASAISKWRQAGQGEKSIPIQIEVLQPDSEAFELAQSLGTHIASDVLSIRVVQSRFQEVHAEFLRVFDLFTFNHVGYQNRGLMELFSQMKQSAVAFLTAYDDFHPLLHEIRERGIDPTVWLKDFVLYDVLQHPTCIIVRPINTAA